MYLYKLYSWRSWMIRDHICLTQSWPAEIQHQEQLHQCLVVRVAMAVGTGSSLQCARWVIGFHGLSCSHSSSRFGVGMAIGSWSFGRDLVKVVLFFPDEFEGMKSWNFRKASWGWALLECFFAGPLCFFHYFKIPVVLDRNCSVFFNIEKMEWWDCSELFFIVFTCFYSIVTFFSALHGLGCCSSTSFLELPWFLVWQSIYFSAFEWKSVYWLQGAPSQSKIV